MKSIIEFYQSPTGKMAKDFLCARLRKFLLQNATAKTLIIGYGEPFADDIAAATGGQVFLAFSDGIAAVPWPANGPHNSCIVHSDILPFGDVTFDNVIAMHALEFAPDPARLMHEIQRVVTVDGRVVCIAPHRAGMWSWFDHTPFGEGQSFSRAQMRRLITGAQLSPLSVHTALFPPPLDFSGHKILRGFARGMENAGCYLELAMGGAVVGAAQKQRYAGIGVKATTQPARVRLQWAAAHANNRGDHASTSQS